MLDRLFGDDTFAAVTGGLDAAALRQQVIANNLANVNTPGYKRQEVRFEDNLAAALAQRQDRGDAASPQPLSSVKPRVVTLNSSSERADGNNVDMEAENVDLAINTLKFETLTQSVSGYFSGLKAVINGR